MALNKLANLQRSLGNKVQKPLGEFQKGLFDGVFGKDAFANFTKESGRFDPWSNLGQKQGAGNFSKSWVPGFLAQSPLGHMQMGMLQGMFDNIMNPQALNQDLANIGARTQQAQRNFQANTRFRGSAAGESIRQSIGQAGDALVSRRKSEERDRQLQRALSLSSAITSGFTHPLLQAQGMAQSGFENMMSRAHQKSMMPSSFEKGMGMATGLIDAFMPL
jgi:hypothetical protein